MLDEVRLDLYFIDWVEIWSSGKKLDLNFIVLLVNWSLAKSNFISPYKQDTHVLIDFLECWQFDQVWKIKKAKCAG